MVAVVLEHDKILIAWLRAERVSFSKSGTMINLQSLGSLNNEELRVTHGYSPARTVRLLRIGLCTPACDTQHAGLMREAGGLHVERAARISRGLLCGHLHVQI